jgi:ABC-type multidrug transport system ATPase subunit
VEDDARHILARFLFYGPSVFKKVESLSGGERMRLRLAQLMHQDINVLVLDEPTNHLDIDSREVLEDALQDFDGAIFCVSHDRYFLNKLFSKILWLEDGTFTKYIDRYEEVKRKRKKCKTSVEVKTKSLNTEPTKIVKPQKTTEKQLEEIEERIERLEKEKSQIEKKMVVKQDLSTLQLLQEQLDLLQVDIDTLYRELEVCLEDIF